MGGQRTIITLPNEEKAWLEGYSKAHGISMAEGVRRALMLLRNAEGQSTYTSLVKQTQGLWAVEDGLRCQEQLRSEWENHA